MKRVYRLYAWVILEMILATLVVCPGAGAQTKARPVVFKGARLIDGTGRPVVENSVLVIAGDQIVAAGKAGAVTIPKDADVKDASALLDQLA